MAKNFHNGTTIIVKLYTIFLGEERLELFIAPAVKHTLVSWRRRFQPFNLEEKVWVIEKLWKNIWIQRPKIHQKQIFFSWAKSLLTSVINYISIANRGSMLTNVDIKMKHTDVLIRAPYFFRFKASLVTSKYIHIFPIY